MSDDHRKVLDARGVLASTSRRGNYYDNVVVDSWFVTVKAKLGERFESNGEATAELFDDIEVVDNRRRPHSATGSMRPTEFKRVSQDKLVP